MEKKVYVHGIDFNNYLSRSIVNSICVDSWYENMPNAEIKIWTEDDPEVQAWIKASKWCQKVIELQNWAKLFEYIKNQILFKYGGIVLETDHYVFNDLTKFGCNCTYDWSFFENFYCSWAPSFYKPGNPDFISICEKYDSIDTDDEYFKYLNEKLLGDVSLYRDKPLAIHEEEAYKNFFHLYYSDVYKKTYWHNELVSIGLKVTKKTFVITMTIKLLSGEQISISNSLYYWDQRLNLISLLLKQQFKNPQKKVNLTEVDISLEIDASYEEKEKIENRIRNSFNFITELGGEIKNV